MKANYENRTRQYLPRRTFTIMRVDGRSFHTYTKGMERPYDIRLIAAMSHTTKVLCNEIQGVTFAYGQSDEISLLIGDFNTIHTSAWFDGNIQKMCSVGASIATMAFNGKAEGLNLPSSATFDCRVFTIPDPVEVENYFIWRQQDATRNSIQSYARSYFSHHQLEGKSVSDIHEMFHGVGFNWNNEQPLYKRGYGVTKENGGWVVDQAIPVFTEDRNYLQSMLPTRTD